MYSDLRYTPGGGFNGSRFQPRQLLLSFLCNPTHQDVKVHPIHPLPSRCGHHSSMVRPDPGRVHEPSIHPDPAQMESRARLIEQKANRVRARVRNTITNACSSTLQCGQEPIFNMPLRLDRAIVSTVNGIGFSTYLHITKKG